MDISKFKGGNGKWLTKALFLEKSYEDTTNVVYTLKEADHSMPDGTKLPSLKRLYLDLADTTEYEFATRYLGGWQHWKDLTAHCLREEVDEWREELDLKLQSESIAQLRELAESGDRMACQFFAKKEYRDKRKAGAPSKAEKAGALKDHISKVTRLDEHMKRIKS